MNNDGWGQVGAGQDDMRQAGKDLQHYNQARTADEALPYHRRVQANYNAGGPMKEHMEHEQMRHKQAKEQVKAHIIRHMSRDYNTQYGHER
jgi:hypothetical protein